MMLLIFMLIVGNLQSSLGDKPKSGPFNMKVFNLTDCGERSPGQMVFDLQMESVNDTSGLLKGVLQAPKGIGDDMRVNIEVLRWKESSFSEKAYSFKFNKLCSGMKGIIKDTFTQITQYLRIEDKCPIKAGDYKFKDFLFTPTTSVVKEAIYGLYKSRLEARQDDAVTGCVDIIFSTVPKKG